MLADRPMGDEGYIFYWMQAAVRSAQNHALEFAVKQANEAGKPLVVGFGLDLDYPEATPRTMQFLVEGLVDVAGRLLQRNLELVVREGHPREVAHELASDAAAVVTERAYLREPRAWRNQLAKHLDVPMWEIETNVVVPVEVASDKREYAARTIRPKIHELLDEFSEKLVTTSLDWGGGAPQLDSLPVTAAAELLESVGLTHDTDAPIAGGESAARATLQAFVADRLDRYADGSSTDFTAGSSSQLSMYLHYGHISALEILRKVRAADAPDAAVDDFVEELVVRRELAHNYVWFEPDYDKFSSLPDWARETLREHRDDERDEVYTITELAEGKTSDPYWNAAMVEMRETGYLHNRMRMYWGKRILHWTNTPEYAYRVALELNNRYLYDGRDPNSYANIGWIFGLHDQAFGENPVFGKVRPMTTAGLERKIDTDAYLAWVADRTGKEIHGAPTD